MYSQAKELILRPWRREDLEDLVCLANNEKISKYLLSTFPYPYKREDGEKWIDYCLLEGFKTQRALLYHSKIAGGIGIDVNEDIHRKSAEIGYWLGEIYWGKGIMPIAVSEFTQVCFEQYDFNRLYARVCSANPSSGKVLEKAGYTYKCAFEKDMVFGDEIFDTLVYEKINPIKFKKPS